MFWTRLKRPMLKPGMSGRKQHKQPGVDMTFWLLVQAYQTSGLHMQSVSAMQPGAFSTSARQVAAPNINRPAVICCGILARACISRDGAQCWQQAITATLGGWSEVDGFRYIYRAISLCLRLYRMMSAM